MAPALAAGLVEPDVVVVAASGTSGAGQVAEGEPARLRGDGVGVRLRRRRRASAHPGDGAEPVRGRRRAGHRVVHPGAGADVPRHPGHRQRAGRAPASTVDDVRAVYEKAYGDEPFVHLLPAGQWPTTAATLGANTVLLQVAVDEAAGRVVVVAALDNLTKGTAGAAVQCLNLALGLPETTGLSTVGVAP